jgi:GT2 family glycosyltransferase
MLLPASVIICSRDRPDLLHHTIASILSGDELPAEIIVIDQSVTPVPLGACAESPAGCAVRHVPGLGVGLSRGRNQGGSAATENVLIFTDDDMSADPRWLGAIVRAALGAGPRGVVTGRVLAGAAETAGGFVPALAQREAPAVYEGRLNRDVLAGGNMALSRALFNDIGGFDVRLGAGSRFPAAEDNDLGFRLLEAGCRVTYVPEAVLYHRAWRPAQAYVPLRYSYGRGKGGYYAKYLSVRDPHMLRRLTMDLLRRLARASRRLHHPRLATGELAYGVGVLEGVADWFIRVRWSIGQRHVVAAARRSAPALSGKRAGRARSPSQDA